MKPRLIQTGHGLDIEYVENTYSVADIAGMKAIAANDLEAGASVHVTSLKTTFFFDPTSTATPDDVEVVKPTYGNGGRWIKEHGVASAIVVEGTGLIAQTIVDGKPTPESWADNFTADRSALNSLVVGQLDRPVWNTAPNKVSVRSVAGADSEARRSLVWVNDVNAAAAGAYLMIPFTVPTGVTQVRLELDSVQRSSYGATGEAALQLYDATGITQVSSTSFTPGASSANVVSQGITVTPGAEYQVRLVCNVSGQSSFICGNLRVRPTAVDATADSVFRSDFRRIDIDQTALQFSIETETKYFNPRYAPQSPFSILGLLTNARRIVVQTFNNIGDFIGSGAGGRDNLAVKFNKYPANTTLSPAVGCVSYLPVTPPKGRNKIEITSGPQAVNALAAPVTETRGSFICAVYVPAIAYVEILPQPAPVAGKVIFVDGDSKLGGYYSDIPGRDCWVELLRQRGWQVWCSAVGGNTLSSFWSGAASVDACVPRAKKIKRCRPDYVVIGNGRNDLRGGATAANVALYRKNAATAVYNETGAIVYLATFSREDALYDNADYDTVRTTDKANQLENAAWCRLADLANLWSKSDATAGNYTSDGVHPSSKGQALIACVFAGDSFPWTPERLGTAAVSWDPESGITAGAMGAVTSAGTTPPTVTLSGTAALCARLFLQITTGGARGTARFRWSLDGGRSWVGQDVLTAATVTLAPFGVTVGFAAGNYATDNTYYADATIGTAGSPALTGAGNITTIPAGMNNQRVFSCVGGSKYMRLQGLDIPAPYTLCVIGRLTNPAPPKAFFGPGSGNNENAPTVYSDSATTIAIAGGNAKQYQMTVTATNPHCYVFVVNGANSYGWLDGVRVWGPLLIDAHTIHDIAVGGRVDMGLWCDRDIGYGRLDARVLPDDEIRSLSAWARDKYGTP